VSPSDQTPDISSGDQPPVGAPPGTHKPSSMSSTPSAERAPPSEQTLRNSRSKVKNVVDLVTYAIDDPARTRRLVLLIATIGGCLALVIFVLDLQPGRLASVAAVATSVLTTALVARRWRHAAIPGPRRRKPRR
jgi:hypothetical protein